MGLSSELFGEYVVHNTPKAQPKHIYVSQIAAAAGKMTVLV